jgi:hypothetical protein
MHGINIKLKPRVFSTNNFVPILNIVASKLSRRVTVVDVILWGLSADGNKNLLN